MSNHLPVLARAGLVVAEKNGRIVSYRADVEGMQSVIAFLVNDRCDGHPELSNLAAADAAACCAAASVENRRARRKEGHRQASSNLDVREKLTDLTLKNC